MRISSIKKLFKTEKSKPDKKRGKRHRDENREIGIITYAFLSVFIALIVYLGLYVQFKSRSVVNNPYNKRQHILEEKLIRGDIVTKNGDILATSVNGADGSYERVYPYENMFAHVVGFSTHGVLGVESSQNFRLLECSNNPLLRVENDLSGKKNTGDTIVTTLNLDMQKAAYEGLGNNKGAVIAMNAKTGEILAAVSKPDFDPNYINDNWDYLNSSEVDNPLLNRVFLGLYPPGSTFKIVTTLEYIREHKNDFKDYSFDCNGSFAYEGTVINCFHGQSHGKVDFTESFAKSCNSSYANISSKLDREEFGRTCDDLLFNEELPGLFSSSKGITNINGKSSTDDLLQSGIGQGKTLASPAQMAYITSAIVNGGILMEPTVVSKICSSTGRDVEIFECKEYRRLMEKDESDILFELMRSVVTDGTASKLKDTNGYFAGGKTGSAEYSSNKSLSHAWFTGYATDNSDYIVVTVIVEGGGSGGEKAVPIARSVFDAYYDK